MLNEEYQEFPCSYYLTQRFFSKKRCEFYNLSVKKQHIPLKHLPGSAQVDVGDLYYLDTNGEKQKGYLIIMAFPYSNAVYGQAFKGKSSECILQGLKNIFLHIGGVPYEITFDNDKALVKICEGQQTKMLTDLFLRFKNHYNFRTHFCNLHSPNEKANVEVGIRALRIKEFSPMSVIADFDEFNRQLLSLCDNAQERIRRGYKTVQITDMFTTDRQNLVPLPEIDFEVQTSRKRVCDTMGRIIIGGNCNYFLSPEFGKKKVIVKSTYNRIYFYDEYERPISNCTRLFDADGAVVIDWGKYLKLLSRKSGAIEHCGIIDCLPEVLREFLLDNERSVHRDYMRIMHDIYSKSDLESAIAFATKATEDCVMEYAELEKRVQLL
jgi:hypothetical protein